MTLRTFLLLGGVTVALVVMGLLLLALLRHRAEQGQRGEGPPFHQNLFVELLWNIVPLAILVALAWPSLQLALQKLAQGH